MDTPSGNVTLTAALDIQAPDESRPAKVEILAYAGGIMSVPNWGPMVIDLSGLRVAASVQFLVDHENKIAATIGSGTATVSNGKLYATGTISRNSIEGPRIIAMHKDGTAFQASVGVVPDADAAEQIRPGQTVQVNGQMLTAPSTGMWLIRAGLLREITICSLGCDADTSVSIAASSTLKGSVMSDTNATPTTEQPVQASQPGQSIEAVANIRAAVANDLRRQAEIQAVASGFPQIAATAIEQGWSKDQAENAVLRAKLGQQSGNVSNWQSGGGRLGASTTAQIEACLLLRAGHEKAAVEAYGENVVQQASDIRASSLPDLAIMAMQLDGHVPPRDRGEMIRAAFSTTSLPTALSNATNKALLQAYKESPATWRSFAAVKSANNFKDHKSIRPSFVGQVEQVGPGGQIKHGSMAESVFTWSVDTYAKQYSVTRRDVINDDLSFLDEAPTLMARAYMRKVSDLVWTTIMAGIGTYFSTGNGNSYTGSASALDLASLTYVVKQMRKQRDSEGNDLDIMPRTLTVSPDLEMTAKNILNSVQVQAAEGEPMGNALASVATLDIEPRLSNTDKFSAASTTQWYLWASPSDTPVIVAFLNGQQAPTSEFFGLDHDSDTLGMKFRVYGDFGCELGDPKAGQYSKGAA